MSYYELAESQKYVKEYIKKSHNIFKVSYILENKYGASNYAPIPIVIRQALNTRVWDVDGKSYLDFLSAYGSVNQGHNHPRIIRAMHEQSKDYQLHLVLSIMINLENIPK